MRSSFRCGLAILCALSPLFVHAQSLPSPDVTTRTTTDNSTKAATTAFVNNLIGSLKGSVSGLAGLDAAGRLPGSQMATGYYVRPLLEFKNVGDNDDTGALSRGLDWIVAGTDDRTLALPQIVNVSTSMAQRAITGTKRIALMAQYGTTRIVVTDGVSPLSFLRDFGAGFQMRGHIQIVRSVVSGAAAEAGTALLLDYNTASPTTGTVGVVNIDHLDITASLNGYGFKIGAKIVSVINMAIGDFTYHGASPNNLETPGNAQANGAAYSSALWLHGANTSAFLIGSHINRAVTTGANTGLRLTGAIQGLTVNMLDSVGNAYGVQGDFADADLAEEIRILGGSYNSYRKNIYLAAVGGVYIDNGIHLRYSPTTAAPWTAVELFNCVEYKVDGQKGHGGLLSYSGGITDTNRETGFYDSSTGAAATGNGTISGMGIDSIYGPEHRLAAAVQNKTFGMYSAAGVQGGNDIGSPDKNFNMGGYINGGFYGPPAMPITSYVYSSSATFKGLSDPSKYFGKAAILFGGNPTPALVISNGTNWIYPNGATVQ